MIFSLKVIFKNPMNSISSVPHNFFVSLFVIDLLHSPELIYGSHEIKNVLYISRLQTYPVISSIINDFILINQNP